MKKFLIFILLLELCISYAQPQKDSLMLKSIYKTALLNGHAYDWLDYLTNQIGGRLSGSLNAERAVDWSKEELFFFLEKPKDYIKGTKMVYKGLVKTSDRVDLITYLESLK